MMSRTIRRDDMSGLLAALDIPEHIRVQGITFSPEGPPFMHGASVVMDRHDVTKANSEACWALGLDPATITRLEVTRDGAMVTWKGEAREWVPFDDEVSR